MFNGVSLYGQHIFYTWTPLNILWTFHVIQMYSTVFKGLKYVTQHVLKWHSAKPLPESLLADCQLEPKKQTSVKFEFSWDFFHEIALKISGERFRLFCTKTDEFKSVVHRDRYNNPTDCCQGYVTYYNAARKTFDFFIKGHLSNYHFHWKAHWP